MIFGWLWDRIPLVASLRYALAETQDALSSQVETVLAREKELGQVYHELELAQAKRISAESISSERKDELLRLIEELKESRESLSSVLSERVRSLDALNSRLLSERSVLPETPDLKAFQRKLEDSAMDKALSAAHTTVKDMRKREFEMDMTLLRKHHPQFQKTLVPDGTSDVDLSADHVGVSPV